MGFIPPNPPPKKQVGRVSDDVYTVDDSGSLIDVAEVSPSAYCNRMDFDSSYDNSE